MYQIIKTSDGSHTVYVPDLDEHFHSVHGAVQESSIVYINNGYTFCRKDPVRIFEAGFGTGLNALLTADRCITEKRTVFYTSIEKDPLPEEITSLFNYSDYAGDYGKQLFAAIHLAEWGKEVEISEYFHLTKIKGDLSLESLTGKFDLVYFDAFGPDKQPEMWSKEIFTKITEILDESGVLVTYSSKGSVKRILKACGFSVGLLPGPPGKREVIRAIKNS